MRITTLVENSEGSQGCIAEHGLSFYVETAGHKLLCDTGATDALINNAEILGIDLKKVDTVFLSHGHYDHAGGLPAFFKVNQNADLYVREGADKDYYNSDRYIGIDKPAIMNYPKLKVLSGDTKIDEELFAFGDVSGRRLWPKGNLTLRCRCEGEFLQDSFDHEHNLVIKEGDKLVLISGCAHNGILNILDRFYEIFERQPDYVLSGFHMKKNSLYEEDDIKIIEDTAKELTRMDTVFYSGHCTSKPAVDIMKQIMGEKLKELCTGMEISL